MKVKLKYFDPTDASTFVNKSLGKHIIADGMTTFPVYKGKTHSIREIVNENGTVNVKEAKKIMEEVAEYFGGNKMQHRLENPVWHKEDPTTWDHTVKVAKNAWSIPTPEGYTKLDLMIAALGHDFGKILSGDGHAEVSYNLIKLIFPDATEKLLNAIRKHMDPVEELVKGMTKLEGSVLLKLFEEFGSNIKRFKIFDKENEVGEVGIILSPRTKTINIEAITAEKGKGYGQKAYEAISKQFPDYTLISDVDALSIDAEKMWERLVEKGKAIKFGPKDYLYVSESDQLMLATKFADLGVVPGADLTKLGFSAAEIEAIEKSKWFKEGGSLIKNNTNMNNETFIEAFAGGGLLKALGFSEKTFAKNAGEMFEDLIKTKVFGGNNKKLAEATEKALIKKAEDFGEELTEHTSAEDLKFLLDELTPLDILSLAGESVAKGSYKKASVFSPRETVMGYSEIFGDSVKLDFKELERAVKGVDGKVGTLTPRHEAIGTSSIGYNLGAETYTLRGSRKSTYKGEQDLVYRIDDPEVLLFRNEILVPLALDRGADLNLVAYLRNHGVAGAVERTGLTNLTQNLTTYSDGFARLNLSRLTELPGSKIKSILIHENLGHGLEGFLDPKYIREFGKLPGASLVRDGAEDIRAIMAEAKFFLWRLAKKQSGLDKITPELLNEFISKISDSDLKKLFALLNHLGLGSPGTGTTLSKVITASNADTYKKVLGTMLGVTPIAVGLASQSDGDTLKFLEGGQLPTSVPEEESLEVADDYEDFYNSEYNDNYITRQFRHLPDELVAEAFDDDLNDLYTSRNIKKGELTKRAELLLLKKYNLDYTQLQETLEDIFNEGFGLALVQDLIDSKKLFEESYELPIKAESGTVLLLKKSSKGSVKESLKESLKKERVLAASKILGVLTGEGTYATSKKLRQAIETNSLTKDLLELIGALQGEEGSVAREILRRMKSKKAVPRELIEDFLKSPQGKTFRNRFKKGTAFSAQIKELEIATKLSTETEDLIKNFKSRTDDLDVPVGALSGARSIPSKTLVHLLERSAEKTNDERIKLLSLAVGEAYEHNIAFPEEFLTLIGGILKKSTTHKNSELTTLNAKVLKASDLTPAMSKKIDFAVDSLQDIVNNKFKSSKQLLQYTYSSTRGAILHSSDIKLWTELQRKYFSETEWSKIAEALVGNVSKLSEITPKEIEEFANSGKIPERFKENPYHVTTGKQKELEKFYEASNENIADLRFRAKLAQLLTDYLISIGLLPKGSKVKITPIQGNSPIKMLLPDDSGKLVMQEIEGMDHLVGYNFTVNGEELFPGLRVKLEQHHAVPLGYLMGMVKTKYKDVSDPRELFKLYKKEKADPNGIFKDIDPQFLLLTKEQHVGLEGIHHSDLYEPGDIARMKALSGSGLFGSFLEVEDFYSPVFNEGVASALSKGSVETQSEIMNRMAIDPLYRKEVTLTWRATRQAEAQAKAEAKAARLDQRRREKLGETAVTYKTYLLENNIPAPEFLKDARAHPLKYPGMYEFLKVFSDDEILAEKMLSAKRGAKLIKKNAFGGALMRELVPKISEAVTKLIPSINPKLAESLLIKSLAKGEISEQSLKIIVEGKGKDLADILKKTETFKGIIKSPSKAALRGKVISPKDLEEGMLDFDNYWYFGHGTDLNHLLPILDAGLTGGLFDTRINLFFIGNLEEFNNFLRMAQEGNGLHHNARGFSIIEVPKLPNQNKPPKDLLDYLNPEELFNLQEDRIPPRFNLFAIDTTK